MTEFYKKIPLIDCGVEPNSLTKKRKKKSREYEQVSRFHQRSLQEVLGSKVIWGEKFGDYTILFGSKSKKGIPTVHPDFFYLTEDEYSKERSMKVVGLLRLKQLYYTIKSSEFLLSHGLPTEHITSIDVIKSINGIEIEEIIRKLKYAAEVEMRTEFEDVFSEEELLEINELLNHLDREKFAIIERSLPLSERLRDVGKMDVGSTEEEKIKNREEFDKAMKRVFWWVNARNAILSKNEDKKTPEKIKYSVLGYNQETQSFKYDYKSESDIAYYFSYALPRMMGEYLAKMHNLGVAHGFATPHNWTLDGSLVDCDSIHGEPINGIKITEDDIFQDLLHSAKTILSYVLPDSSRNYILQEIITKEMQEKLDEKKDGEEVSYIVLSYFFEEYYKFFRLKEGDVNSFLNKFDAWVEKNQ